MQVLGTVAELRLPTGIRGTEREHRYRHILELQLIRMLLKEFNDCPNPLLLNVIGSQAHSGITVFYSFAEDLQRSTDAMYHPHAVAHSCCIILCL